MTSRPAVRRATDLAFRAVCGLAFLAAITPLLLLVVHAVPRALEVLGPATGGGHAIRSGAGEAISRAASGSVLVAGLAALFGVPIGVLAGAYSSESRRGGRVARFAIDLLAGVPAVVVGLTVYLLVVLPMRRHSAIAGAVALALVIIPPVARGTDALLRLVPQALRDVATSLGLSRWRVVLLALLPSVARGVAATAAVAVSRALGETAPLLLTSSHGTGWPTGVLDATTTLPMAIWLSAGSPHADQRARAWAAALLLLLLSLALHAAAGVLRRRGEGSRR